MPESAWTVVFYVRQDGRCPVEEFLDSLSLEERVRMNRQIGRLETWGPRLAPPDAQFLRDKVHELRARWHNVQLRVLYFRDGRTFILASGFKKKARAVPDSEIDRALDCREDYFRRRGEQ